MTQNWIIFSAVFTFLSGVCNSVQSEVITISVLRDGFKPVRYQRASHSPPYQTKVTNERPKEISKTPKYTGVQQWYGYLNLGLEPTRFYFCCDQQQNGKFHLYFDRNHNQNLSDDGLPIKNQGSKNGGPEGFACLIEIPWSVLTNDHRVKGNFDLWFFTNSGSWNSGNRVCHYSRTHLGGQVQVENHVYSVLLIDSGYNDANLMNDGVVLDLNQNGKLDKDEKSQTYYTINNKKYEFRVIWDMP